MMTATRSSKGNLSFTHKTYIQPLVRLILISSKPLLLLATATNKHTADWGSLQQGQGDGPERDAVELELAGHLGGGVGLAGVGEPLDEDVTLVPVGGHPRLLHPRERRQEP